MEQIEREEAELWWGQRTWWVGGVERELLWWWCRGAKEGDVFMGPAVRRTPRQIT